MVGLILLREIKILLKDKTAVMILLVMPMVLLSILGLALQGSFSNYEWTDPIHIAIVTEYTEMSPEEILKEASPNEMAYQGIMANLGGDTSQLDPGSWFFEEFLKDEQINKMIDYEVMDSASAKQALDDGKVSSIITLPAEFESNILSSLFFDEVQSVEISVVSNNPNSLSYKIVGALMKAFASVINDNHMKQKLLSNVMSQAADGLQGAGAFSQSLESAEIEIKIESLYKRPALSSFQYYSAAILAMFLFYGAGFAGTRILDEMKNNTFQRQIAARIKPWQILTANALLGSLISMIQMVIIMIFSRLVLGVNWGSLSVTVAGMLGAAAAMGGINLFLAVLTVRTENYQMINGFRNILIHIFALLGGSYLPLEMLPKIIQRLSFFTLNGLAIKTWTKGMQLYTIVEVLPLLGGMLAFAAGFAGIGLLMYPWKGGAKRV